MQGHPSPFRPVRTKKSGTRRKIPKHIRDVSIYLANDVLLGKDLLHSRRRSVRPRRNPCRDKRTVTVPRRRFDIARKLQQSGEVIGQYIGIVRGKDGVRAFPCVRERGIAAGRAVLIREPDEPVRNGR